MIALHNTDCALRNCIIIGVCLLSAMSGAASPVRTVDPCVIDGPNMAQTLAYINAIHRDKDPLEYGPLEYNASLGTLTRSWQTTMDNGNHSRIFHKSRAAVLALNCHTEATDESATLSCLDGSLCFWITSDLWLDGVDQGIGTYNRYEEHGFSIWVGFDPEKADLMARAFSHLVVLIQQDYKVRHSHLNDPFAKP